MFSYKKHLFVFLHNQRYSYQLTIAAASTNYAKLAIWKQTYVITVNAVTYNMCVLDRSDVLNLALSPSIFCATSISGPLGGFGNEIVCCWCCCRRSCNTTMIFSVWLLMFSQSVSLQSWTALTVEGTGPSPSDEVESAGTNSIGAVFMRQHDDELHDGLNTPLFDWLDVEHWTNINFTTSAFIPLRYQISVADFDSSTNNTLQMRNEVLMHRLVYRNQRVVGAFTSHSSRVRWFQLGWVAPTLTQAPHFVLLQDGTLPYLDGLIRFMPSITVNAHGTIVLGEYCSSAFRNTL